MLVADDHAAPLDGGGPTVALTGGGLATSGTTRAPLAQPGMRSSTT